MSLLHIVILALVQGITEFLPISSSGHLILVPSLTGWEDQGLLVDVAVHVGTLGAVVVYFWRDVYDMAIGSLRLISGQWDPGARLALYIVLATIPVIIAGFLLNKAYPGGLRSVEIIAWTTLGFGILLYLADRFRATARTIDQITLKDAMVIGGMQVLALIPGTSRSGITMTAARALGYSRPDAARFSLLLSIPTILGAGTLGGIELYQTHDATLTADAITAAGLAFLSALVAIWAMMTWLKRASFTPFVIYRIVLGGGLLILAYGFGG